LALSDWYDKNLINPHERCVRRRGRGEGILAIVVFIMLLSARCTLVTRRVIQSVSQSALSGESVW
jgi:hypothetical protein